MNKFSQIHKENPKVEDREVTTLLAENGIRDINDYLIFKGKKDQKKFIKTYEVLKDENTITFNEDEQTVIAQTIDGDYIISCLEGIQVVDVSLDKNITEFYEGYTPLEFLSDYVDGKIKSNILVKLDS